MSVWWALLLRGEPEQFLVIVCYLCEADTLLRPVPPLQLAELQFRKSGTQPLTSVVFPIAKSTIGIPYTTCYFRKSLWQDDEEGCNVAPHFLPKC
jgi:hypothetical protein